MVPGARAIHRRTPRTTTATQAGATSPTSTRPSQAASPPTRSPCARRADELPKAAEETAGAAGRARRRPGRTSSHASGSRRLHAPSTSRRRRSRSVPSRPGLSGHRRQLAHAGHDRDPHQRLFSQDQRGLHRHAEAGGGRALRSRPPARSRSPTVRLHITRGSARSSQVVAEQSLTVAKAHQKDAENQFAVGNASKADVLQAQTRRPPPPSSQRRASEERRLHRGAPGASRHPRQGRREAPAGRVARRPALPAPDGREEARPVKRTARAPS